MMVALGQGIAGSFTPSDALAQKLNTASSHVGAHLRIASALLRRCCCSPLAGLRHCEQVHVRNRPKSALQ